MYFILVNEYYFISTKLVFIFSGISGKSQILFAIVYTTRYLDLFTSFVSVYNSVMKIVFLTASYGTLYLMFFKFKPTYDHNHDSFRYLYFYSVIYAKLND